MKCFNCEKEGHGTRTCPEPKKERPCFNCGQVGHMRGDCTNEKVPSCMNCKKFGHVMKECTEEIRICYKCK